MKTLTLRWSARSRQPWAVGVAVVIEGRNVSRLSRLEQLFQPAESHHADSSKILDLR